MDEDIRINFLKEFLNFFWLRPENALLLALRAEAYRTTLSLFGNGDNTMDVSCGDGIFSFITFGGKLSEKTDMFRSVKTSQTFRDENYDTFDYFDESYFVEIKNRPDLNYQYGSDWKQNLLSKAKKLDFYKEFLLHDNNKGFPFENEKFKYIYTNSAYWVKNFQKHLEDLSRLTVSGGHIILEMKTTNIKNYQAKNYLQFMGNRFHEIVEGGRLASSKGIRSINVVLSIIKQIGNIDIVEYKPVYGGLMAQIWDVGLRPLYNPLVKMANCTSIEQRIEIKKEWNQVLFEMFSEFIKNYRADEKTAIEYLIVLKKKMK